MEINFVFSIIVLIASVIVHELSHGYAAYFLGDSTAKYAGRLTLNPLRHLELFGSFILPTLSYMLGGSIFGWAKPVPFNPYNLRVKKWGEAIVAGAGPFSNLLIAFVFGLILRNSAGDSFGVLSPSEYLMSTIVLINITLAVFNLIPIPPLDGSKILYSVLPAKLYKIKETLERNSILFILIVLFVLWQFIEPLIPFLFKLFTGISF